MAETRVDLNTGFTSGPAGLSRDSKWIQGHEQPEEVLSNSRGPLKRGVTEPDDFPKVDIADTNPNNTGDIDVSALFPAMHKKTSHQGGNRSNKTNDGKSKTAGKI